MSDYYTTVRGVRYPMLAELSPQDMIKAYEMGVKEWSARFPNDLFNPDDKTRSSFEN